MATMERTTETSRAGKSFCPTPTAASGSSRSRLSVFTSARTRRSAACGLADNHLSLAWSVGKVMNWRNFGPCPSRGSTKYRASLSCCTAMAVAGSPAPCPPSAPPGRGRAGGRAPPADSDDGHVLVGLEAGILEERAQGQVGAAARARHAEPRSLEILDLLGGKILAHHHVERV